MKTHRRLADVDVSALREELAAHPELWGEHSGRKMGPHAEMTDIWPRYRSPEELTSPAAYGEPHLPVWYPCIEKLPSVKKIALDLMAVVGGEILGGILITKLAPGGEIASHVDGGWHAGFYQKFYVAVQNRPGSVFGWEDGDIHASDGQVYWFRNDVPHWVTNDSSEDRISMIVCIRTEIYDGV